MDMDSESIVENLCNESELTKQFVQSFDKTFLNKAAEVSHILAKLGIEVDSTEEFDENVCANILEQFQATLLKIGNSTVNDCEKQLKCDRNEIDQLIARLESLKMRKQNIELDQEEQSCKKQNIEKFNCLRKNYLKSLNKLSLIADKDTETNFLLKESFKNETLKMEIESLEKELAPFSNFKHLDNEKQLDNGIAHLNQKYQKLLEVEVSF